MLLFLSRIRKGVFLKSLDRRLTAATIAVPFIGLALKCAQERASGVTKQSLTPPLAQAICMQSYSNYSSKKCRKNSLGITMNPRTDDWFVFIYLPSFILQSGSLPTPSRDGAAYIYFGQGFPSRNNQMRTFLIRRVLEGFVVDVKRNLQIFFGPIGIRRQSAGRSSPSNDRRFVEIKRQ